MLFAHQVQSEDAEISTINKFWSIVKLQYVSKIIELLGNLVKLRKLFLSSESDLTFMVSHWIVIEKI